MHIHAAISDRPCHASAFTLSNMLPVFPTVLFSEPEIDEINFVFADLVFGVAHEKIRWFDVSVDYPSRVEKLDLFEDLHHNHQARFEGHWVNLGGVVVVHLARK